MKLTIKTAALLLLTLVFLNPAVAEDIKLTKIGDMYTVPMRLNDSLTMNFMLDTGAADIGFPDEIVDGLLRTGVIQQSDLKGSKTYTLADGSSIKCQRLVLRKVRIGSSNVENVEASSCPGKALLLLGQSVLKKLGAWTMDYSKDALVVSGGNKDIGESPTYTAKDIDWYEKAEVQYDAIAQYNLGILYYKGEGLPRSLVKAFELFMKAAKQGLAEAQYNVGVMCENGEGVPKNMAMAVEWYRKAAAQKNSLVSSAAQKALGVMYGKGEGVPQDFSISFKWFQKAAAQGNAKAQSYLGAMYNDGIGVPKDTAKAIELYQRAANQGETVAQYNLSVKYYKGEGVPKDIAKALYWRQKAADQGYAAAQYYLGVMYYTGDGVTKDLAKAVELHRKAAKQGLADAQYNLGIMYTGSEGLPLDLVLAYAWLNLAAAQQGEIQEKAIKARDTVGQALKPAERTEAKSLATSWRVGQSLERRGK